MPTSKGIIIIGIDPGLATTGFGVIEKKHNTIAVRRCGIISSAPSQPFDKRLFSIFTQLQHIIRQYRPNQLAIEELFFAKNSATALKVGQARGVVLLAACQAKIPIQEFTPLQVKQAVTGYGLASKQQVQKMVRATLHMKTLPTPDDVADALAIAICAAYTKHFS